MEQALRFQIDPQPGESARACAAIARCVIPQGRGTLLLFGLWAAVGIASYFLTPATRDITFLISFSAVFVTMYAQQLVGQSLLRRLRVADPHAAETHYIELSDNGVRSWCAHIDARYPWSEYTKATENNEFYLLVRPNGTGAAIPKRLLDDAANEQLREHIRGWSPDRGANLARVLQTSSR